MGKSGIRGSFAIRQEKTLIKSLVDEISLLIKSKYPVIFLETVDEAYVLRQLRQIASQLKLAYYQWSVTDGLRKEEREGSYYQSREPTIMLQTVLAILETPQEIRQAGLFVLKDFERHIDSSMVLRLFKDLVNRIKNSRDTVVIVAPGYKLPQDIEPYAAHIIGGYPGRDEIGTVIGETIEELRRTNPQIRVELTKQQAGKLAAMLKGLSIQQIRNVIIECTLDDGKLSMDDVGKIEQCKKKIFDKEGILEFCLSESRQNVANFDNLKRWLAERRGSFTAGQSNLPPPKGVLMMGVQGCGKSLAVKVVARELNLPLYRLDLTRLYSKYIGETEQNLRKALAVVEKLSPMCLWIDEIEKCFAASDGDVDGGVSQRILGTFLTWMQERQGGCFIAATANNIYMLPPEFLRKGRFDEIFFVDLPSTELREEIFRIHLTKRGLLPESFDCRTLANESADFNGAEIEQAVISALYRASSQKETITAAHIVEQLRSTKPLAVVKQEDVAMLRDWAKDRTIPA